MDVDTDFDLLFRLKSVNITVDPCQWFVEEETPSHFMSHKRGGRGKGLVIVKLLYLVRST